MLFLEMEADSSTLRSLEYTSRPNWSVADWSTRVLQMGPSSVWAL